MLRLWRCSRGHHQWPPSKPQSPPSPHTPLPPGWVTHSTHTAQASMGSLKCNTTAPENLQWFQPLASLQWCTRALHHWHHCCYRCNHTQTHSPVVLGVETFNQRALWNLKVHKSNIYHQNRTSYKLLASSESYGKGTLCFHTLWPHFTVWATLRTHVVAKNLNILNSHYEFPPSSMT